MIAGKELAASVVDHMTFHFRSMKKCVNLAILSYNQACLLPFRAVSLIATQLN